VAAAALFATATGAELPASDGIVSDGRLPDEAFFRLVTCGASPGGACRAPMLRWDKPRLTLAFPPGEAALQPGFEVMLAAAIAHALGEINAAGMGLQIGMTNSGTADITLRTTDLGEGAPLTETPGFSGPGVMGVGYMTVWSDDADHITEAVILISTTISEADMTSVVLEEITQSLGILYDIENPWYEGVSILSQTSNATTTIEGQDAALLRWLYPPKE
jgi:Protein of unknown function (DUF2927)